ncbi:MAG: Rieske 2Fe-2S domain-containing protein [Acidimicrobiia bacterium]|nr:Rieske 2Fe-2S domain-containing protein [Acidimicrobiia bacterium]
MPSPRTLSASWYGNRAVHQRERLAVWAREWLVFAPLARLDRPGQYVAAEIAGWPIFVVVRPDGSLAGFHNVCAHRAGPILWEGHGTCGNLVCRYHGWAYDWQGALRSARDFGDADGDIDPETHGLTPVRVEAWRNLIWINLDAAAPDLHTSLGSLDDQCREFPMEQFGYTHQVVRTLACNWKTYADNYLEGYHIPLLHPELNREIDVSRYQVLVYPEDDYCLHTAPARDGSANAGRWLFRFPNTALNVYRTGMNVERIFPDGPDRTLVVYDYFFADADDPANADTLKVSEVTLDQDQAICEAVQRNLDAGIYRTGPLSPRHEAAVGWFQDRLRRAVTAVEGEA